MNFVLKQFCEKNEQKKGALGLVSRQVLKDERYISHNLHQALIQLWEYKKFYPINEDALKKFFKEFNKQAK